jgi:hypothetical protein
MMTMKMSFSACQSHGEVEDLRRAFQDRKGNKRLFIDILVQYSLFRFGDLHVRKHVKQTFTLALKTHTGLIYDKFLCTKYMHELRFISHPITAVEFGFLTL